MPISKKCGINCKCDFKTFSLINDKNDFLEAVSRQNVHLVFSDFMAEFLKTNKLDEKKIVKNYLACFNSYDSGNESEPLGCDILYFGTLSPKKGMYQLLLALKDLLVEHDVKLIMAGSGSHGDLYLFAKKLGLEERIILKNYVSKEVLDSLLKRSRLTVVPSLWPEPFGLVGIEAMSAGRPVVAFDVGGIGDWMKDKETGYLIPPRNINEFKNAVERLLSNRDLASRLGGNARKYVRENFNPEKHIDSLMDIYNKELINKTN